MRAGSTATIALAVIALASCNDNPKSETSDAPATGSASQDEESTNAITAGHELPEGYPAAVPLPDGTVTGSSVVGDGVESVWSVQVETEGSEIDAFRTTIESAGFTVDDGAITSADDGTVTYVAQGADYTVAVTNVPGDPATIALSITSVDFARATVAT